MKQKIIILFVILSPLFVNAQYFKIFDIDTTNYPEIRAKYIAVDEKGRQIHNFQQNDIEIHEGTKPVKINQHKNSVKGTPQALSIVLTVDVSGSMNSKKMAIAKEASKTIVKLTPLELSEIAITSFDHKNYLNQDFTKNADLLNKTIDELIPLGGTDYNFGFTKPIAGALHVAKNGYNKKVVIFLTDGLSEGSSEEIIKYANENNIIIYCISVDMVMPEILKDVSAKTGGRSFENVKSITMANKVYTDILQIEQSSTYGTISWTATKKEFPEVTQIKVKASNKGKEINGTSEYKTNDNQVVKLEVSYFTLNLGSNTKVGEPIQTEIKITARNADQTIIKLDNTNNHIFKLSKIKLPFVIKNNESKTIIIKYIPKDLGWISSIINIETKNGYELSLFATGGNPALPSDFNNNFKFVFPNTNTSLLANTDTSIIWSGINKTDSVNIFFSTNGGQEYARIDVSNNLSYPWHIPNIEQKNCKFKILKIIDIKENRILDTNYLSKIKFSEKSKIFTLRNNNFDTLCLFTEQKQPIKLTKIKERKISPDNFFVSRTGEYIIFTDKNSTQASLWNIINNKKISDLERHDYTISDVKFSSNDSMFVTIANNKKTVVWETETGSLINNFIYEKRGRVIAISPDSKKVAVAYEDKNIIIWDIKTGAEISKLKKHKSNIKVLEFSQDSKRLLSAAEDGFIILWDIETNKKIDVFKHKQKIITAFFASNEQKIISTSADNTAIIWDIENKKNKIILNKHTSDVIDAKINAKGDNIITLSKDKTAILWDYPSGNYLRTIKLKIASSKNIVYFSNNELIISNNNSNYDLYNLDSTQYSKDFYYTNEKAPGSLILNFKKETSLVLNVEFNNSCNKLILATVDGNAKIKDLKTGNTLNKIEGITGEASYSPDEKSIFAINKNTLSVRTSEGDFKYSLGGSLGHKKNITTAEYSPDSKIIFTASEDGFLKLWESKSSKHLGDININEAITLATFNNDATKIIAITEYNIYIVDVGKKIVLEKIKTEHPQLSIITSPDNECFITTDGKRTTIYKLENGNKLYEFEGRFIDIVEGSNKLAIQNKNNLNFIDYKTGNFLYKIPKINEVYDFSPDGNRYISKNYMGLNVCDINSGKTLYNLKFKSIFSEKLDIFFSPDGNKILIVKNNNVSIWYAPQILIAESESFDIVRPIPQTHDVVFASPILLNSEIRGSRKILSNKTKYPIIIKNIEIEGKNANCFSLDKGFSKQIIQPNTSLEILFKFKPDSWGQKSANVIIHTPTDTLVATIRGTAVKDGFDRLNDEVYFGKVKPLQQKDTTISVLKNTTANDLEILKIETTGPDKTQFQLKCDEKIIKRGEDLILKIEFNPQKQGLTNCNYKIYIKGKENSPIEFTANGEGDAPRIIKVNGKITDKDTNKPVESQIFCYDYMSGTCLDTTQTDIFGNYSLKIFVDREYVIIAEAKNYLPASDKINLTLLILEPELESNIEISQIKEGGFSLIHSISFESGNTELTDDIIVELDHFLKMLKSNKKIEIEISGHTDSKGSEQSNQKISLNRAESIEDYLIIKGIDKTRITTTGKGEIQPITTNDTKEGREQNRRVEIRIIKM